MASGADRSSARTVVAEPASNTSAISATAAEKRIITGVL
jgi:hypothetical protein